MNSRGSDCRGPMNQSQKKNKGSGSQSKKRPAQKGMTPPKRGTSIVQSAPVARARISSGSAAVVRSKANGDCMVSHREYLGDISMTNGFSARQYPINAGVAKTFPWLSQLASRFEEFSFKKLKFEYRPRCSTAQSGAVFLCPDFDASDAAPVSKTQAMSYQSLMDGAAWTEFAQVCTPLELSRLKSYYVRTGANPSGTDIKLYDVGNLFACTQGVDTNFVGELWVDYDVELKIPQIGGDVPGTGLSVFTTSVTKAAVFGAGVPSLSRGMNADVTFGANSITFNSACQILLTIRSYGTVITAQPVLGGTATSSLSTTLINAGATVNDCVYAVNAQPGQTVTFDYTASSTTITESDVRIALYTYAAL